MRSVGRPPVEQHENDRVQRRIALSVLDQSPVPEGSTAAAALRESVDLARATEAMGYRRYWVAEHHNTPSLAATAPEVVVAVVAAATSTIRVGSGGVLLPYYSPLKVAEVFRTLHALFPGRIDLGVGRAAGTDAAAEAALLASGGASGEERFPEHLADLVALVAGHAGGDDGPVRAMPDGPIRAVSDGPIRAVPDGPIRAMPDGPGAPEVWLLGSSSYSSACAAYLGLPFAFAHFITPDHGPQIVASYRRGFRAGGAQAPRAVVAVAALCADTDEEALRQAATTDRWRLGPEGAERPPIVPPEAAAAHRWTELDRARAAQSRAKVLVGTPDRVGADLVSVADDFGVDEVLVVTVCHDLGARRRSYELLAEAFDLTSAPAG